MIISGSLNFGSNQKQKCSLSFISKNNYVSENLIWFVFLSTVQFFILITYMYIYINKIYEWKLYKTKIKNN